MKADGKKIKMAVGIAALVVIVAAWPLRPIVQSTRRSVLWNGTSRQ